jgi:uncharacterized protein YcnI
MNAPSIARRFPIALAALASLSLLTAGPALGHAQLVPAEGLADGQPYMLSVPNEIDDATTTKVVLTVPEGFSIGLVAASPGWEREDATVGSGDDARLGQVTWTSTTGGSAEGGLFEFAGRGDPGTYTFEVQQSYSDGTVVDWAGPEDSDEPAPVVETKSSFASGSSSTLAIVAIVVGAIGVLLGGVALATRGGGRQA